MPKEAPKTPPRGPQKASKIVPLLKMAERPNLTTVLRIEALSGSRGAPKMALQRGKITHEICIDLRILKNLLEEGSGRVPGAKKSSRRGAQDRNKVVKIALEPS